MTVLGTNSVEHTADLLLRRAGTTRLTVTSTGISLGGDLTLGNGGTALLPQIRFDSNSGFYSTSDRIYISANGANATYFDGTNQFNYGNIYVTTTDDSAVNSTTTTRASSGFYLRGKYWNGTAQVNLDWNIISVPTDTVGNSQFRIRTGSTSRLTVSNSGTVTATTFSGSGASLTSLNAGNLSSGTVSSARLPVASGSASGIVNTGAQTFAGTKTFSGEIRSSLGGGTATTRSINVNGVVEANGFSGRRGLGGTQTNTFNIHWTGTTSRLYIDTTLIGAFAFTSDYRIKKDIENMQDGAISRIMQLRPVTYRNKKYGDVFIEGDTYREGFIAHEVAEIIPSGVSGEKDVVNEMQSLKLDSIVSVLTKALQESIAKINSLESRIAALES